jgi:Putative peptidoglycan binding domain
MAFANSYRRDGKARNLKQDEIVEVQSVFGQSIDLNYVYICRPIRSEAGVITLAGYDASANNFIYQILWSTPVYDNSAVIETQHDTLIHEMTHVWQGQHGIYPTVYMLQSGYEQLKHGVKDIIDKGEWRTWDEHRGTTYLFNMADIGADWNRFNVEQQASIVESWYIDEMDNRRGHNKYFGEEVYGGGASIYDPRYPYIKDVILAGKPGASYKAVTLPAGASADIKKFQNKLVQLGFLKARFADGIVGGKGSQTRQAVIEFQKFHNLVPDGDLGGPNSLTRAKLNLPLSQLKGKPV